MPDRRPAAVITGIGVVAPGGIGNDAWWNAAKSGQSAIRRITRFDPSQYPAQLAGEVDGFDATDYLEQRLIVQTDHWTHMALAATQFALDDAKYDPEGKDPYRMSVITASGSGGNEFGQKEIENLWGKGPIFVGAYQSIAWFYAATTGQIAIKYGMKGPCGVICQEGAGGLEALWHSRRNIVRGVDFVVSGGTEAPIGPYALTCQLTNGRLSLENDAGGRVPALRRARERLRHGRGRRDRDRRGGWSTRRSARRRRCTREIAGYGATNDAFHPKQASGDGSQLARAMKMALERAGVAADDVDAVFADAAGVPEADRAEASAIKEVFGPGRARDGAEDDDRAPVRRRRAARRGRGGLRDARRRHPAHDQRRLAGGGLRPRLRARRRRRGRSTPCS